MFVLKRFIWNIVSVFVFLRFRTVWELYEYIYEKKLTKGILVSVFQNCVDAKGGYVGLGAKFHSRPYFPHGLHGIFISGGVEVGKNAVIFQQVTLGAIRTKGSAKVGNPVIGDNCYIGAGAKIIGNIRIGNNCRIGANAVVYEDMPDNSIAVCSPTRIITKEEPLDNRFYSVDLEDYEIVWENGAFHRVGLRPDKRHH